MHIILGVTAATLGLFLACKVFFGVFRRFGDSAYRLGNLRRKMPREPRAHKSGLEAINDPVEAIAVLMISFARAARTPKIRLHVEDRLTDLLNGWFDLEPHEVVNMLTVAKQLNTPDLATETVIKMMTDVINPYLNKSERADVVEIIELVRVDDTDLTQVEVDFLILLEAYLELS